MKEKNQMNEELTWGLSPPYINFYDYCLSKAVSAVMPLFAVVKAPVIWSPSDELEVFKAET